MLPPRREVGLKRVERLGDGDWREAGLPRSLGVDFAARQLARLLQCLIVGEQVPVVSGLQIVGGSELLEPAARAAIGEPDAPRSEAALVSAITQCNVQRDADEV